ncbi:Golgi reassembly stacking protein grasp65, contains pdz domain [Globisporangium polare]
MGNESSTLATGAASSGSRARRSSSADDGELLEAAYCGFRVLGIQEQSPASRAGFVSFFDFILEANGIRLDTKDSTLMELIAQSEDRPMQLSVYNVKSQTTRELELTPSREWPGKGLLGVTIRFDSYEGAEDQLLHVLNVVVNSPAHKAGLKPESDYLLGTPERVFRDPEDLHDEILEALEDTFQCYVYNSTELDQVRIVSISPSERWGGEGVLGAEVAHGYLHRLPSSTRSTIGTSVGFVNLAKDAMAATDAFLKRGRPQTQPAQEQGVTTVDEEAAVSQQDAEHVAAHDESGQATADHSEGEQAHVATPEHETQTPEVNAQDETKDEPLPQKEDAASALPEQPASSPAKPRYTARTDWQFPISTVEVYADPTQLS